MPDLSSILLSTTPMEGLQQGLQTGEQFGQSIEQSQLARQRGKEQEQQAQEQAALAPSKLQESQSQAKLDEFKANNPMLSLPSTVNPIVMMDYVGQKYGYDSPQYTQLEKYQKDQSALDSAHTAFYNASAINLASDHQPASVKEAVAAEMGKLGYPAAIAGQMSGRERAQIENNQTTYAQWKQAGGQIQNNLPPSPNIPSAQQSNANSRQNMQNIQNQADDETNVFKSQLAKSSLSTSQQQMLGRANTALKLMQEIEPNLSAFGDYLGASGHAKQMMDKVGSYMGGQPSQDFLKYQNVVTLLPMLKNELSQAFGASKTEAEQDEINKVTSPAFWQNSTATHW
jgi:hypothetical protein